MNEETIEYTLQKYIFIQEKIKSLKAEAEKLKKEIRESMGEEREKKVGNFEIRIQERIRYKYDPYILEASVGPDILKLVKIESVDKKKLEGLVKAGIVSREDIEPAMKIVSRAEALVVKEVGRK